jgi:hypothetical protein
MASGSGLITIPPIILAAEDAPMDDEDPPMDDEDPPWDDEDPPMDDEAPIGDDHELGPAIDTLPMWVIALFFPFEDGGAVLGVAVGVPPVCDAGVVFGFEAPPVEPAYADDAAATLDEVGAATLADGAVNAPLADGPGAAAPDGAVDAAAPLGVGSSM